MRIELLSPPPADPTDTDFPSEVSNLTAMRRARSGDIRLDLPDAVVERLLERANVAGQSLDWYVNSELSKLANRPNADELLARIRQSARATSTEAGSPIEPPVEQHVEQHCTAA